MKNLLLAFTSTCIAACSGGTEANRNTFTQAVNGYLSKRGDLCLAKYDWPIEVSAQELQTGGRNAVQLPVLEKLGVVRSTLVDAEGSSPAKGPSQQTARRYDLTDAGRRYYLKRAGVHEHTADFCAAKLSLDKIVAWEVHKNGGRSEAVVTYTYRVDAAPWAKDADAQRVFPAVARVLRGAGKAQLRETFTLTTAGWAAGKSVD
jgi:hypothetical protein